LRKSKDRGIEVRDLFPSQGECSVGDEPAEEIRSCGETLKQVLRQTFGVESVNLMPRAVSVEALLGTVSTPPPRLRQCLALARAIFSAQWRIPLHQGDC
jgi:hypothetical protein